MCSSIQIVWFPKRACASQEFNSSDRRYEAKDKQRLYIAQPAGMLCKRAGKAKKKLNKKPSKRARRTCRNKLHKRRRARQKSKRQTCLKCCYSHTPSWKEQKKRGSRDRRKDLQHRPCPPPPKKESLPLNWHKDLPASFCNIVCGPCSLILAHFRFVLAPPPSAVYLLACFIYLVNLFMLTNCGNGAVCVYASKMAIWEVEISGNLLKAESVLLWLWKDIT